MGPRVPPDPYRRVGNRRKVLSDSSTTSAKNDEYRRRIAADELTREARTSVASALAELLDRLSRDGLPRAVTALREHWGA